MKRNVLESSDDDRTLDKAIAMLKEQEERIGVLTRAIEQMPKPTKLLDVYGDGYAKVVMCENCKYAKPMCQPWDDIVCTKNSAAHDTYWFCADGERKITDAPD
jgi:hypothetical protein